MKFANYSLFAQDNGKHGLSYAIDHTLKLGFDAVEIYDDAVVEEGWIKGTAHAAQVGKAFAENGLPCVCYSAAADLFRGNEDNALRHVEYAKEIGAFFFHHTLYPAYVPTPSGIAYEEMLSCVADKAERIARRCNEYGMVCLYEPQGYYFNGIRGVMGILREMMARGCDVGVCGDTGNSFYADCPPTDFYRECHPYIRHIHIKNYLPTEAERHIRSISGKSYIPASLDKGIADLPACMAYIPDYAGNVSLEMGGTDDEMHAALNYMKKLFTK